MARLKKAAKGLALPKPVLWILSPGRPDLALDRWLARAATAASDTEVIAA